MKEVQIGATATAHLVVSEADLASALRFPGRDIHAPVFAKSPTAPLAGTPSFETIDIYPPVLATSRMVALMEVASSRVLTPLLDANELSVGVTIDVLHSAPTPVHAKVNATARYTGRENKLFVFEVVAYDDGGEIGRGIHKRAVIVPERLVDRAMRRNNRTP